jgi:hypothetical protein
MAESFKPLKGMIKDTGRMDQVDGTYRDALNLIVDDLKLNVANEYGTRVVTGLTLSLPLASGSITIGMNIVGQIALLDDNFVLFAAGEYTLPSGIVMTVSAIYKVNVANSTSTVLYYTTSVDPTSPGTPNLKGHLNFDLDHPVTAELRESPTQEEIVYFTDNKYTFIIDPDTGIEYVEEYNPPRVFNVTKQEQSIAVTNDPSNLYGNFSRAEFLNLFIDAGRVPDFFAVELLKGGGVTTGAYYLAVAYADENKTETNVLAVSNPVYIVPANDDSFPREMITGAPNGTQTDKSIQWIVSQLNPEYKYIVPYIVQYSGKTKFVYKLEYVTITNPLGEKVVYSGLEKVASSSIEDAVIDKVRYLTAKSITQLDNMLYAANLTSRPDLGYQRFANNIKIEPITLPLTPFDPRRYDIYTLNEGYSQLVYPDPPINYGATNNSSYNVLGTAVGDALRWENFNLSGTFYGPMGKITSGIPYAAFKTLDGISEAYVSSIIIPIQQGRSAGYRDPNLLFKYKGYRRGEVYAFYISFILKDGSESYAYHIPGRDAIESFENSPLGFSHPSLSGLGALGLGLKTGEILSYDPNAMFYQYFDSSYIGSIPLTSNMGYWNNINESYPDNENFDVWGVNSDGTSYKIPFGFFTTLRTLNVRHHKMPSNHNVNFSHIVRDTNFATSGTDDSTVFEEQVRILGIQLQNVKIPKFILKQVQGYKVYYAKRTQGNKTIIGQSGAHPATLYPAANLSNSVDNAKQGPFFNIWSLDGDLKYGGLAISDSLWVHDSANVLATNSNQIKNYDSTVAQSNYIGNPVFKFHDFNLLRKRPTLATATHIDIQYICRMEQWRGGYKGALKSSITDATADDLLNEYYRAFRSGIGDDTFSWIHEDLANMIDFNATSGSVYYDNPGPKILWGNILIAAGYYEPGYSGNVSVTAGSATTAGVLDKGVSYNDPLDGGTYIGEKNDYPNILESYRALLSNTQTVLMLEPEGATYANGLSIIKSATANGFKGATYLYNAFGESSIVLSLASGLPMLGGFASNHWSYVGLSNLMWSLQIYPVINSSNGNIPDHYVGTQVGSLVSYTYARALYGGHDINYTRGDIAFAADSSAINLPKLWYTTEGIFTKMMMKGHSSLRKPYPILGPTFKVGTTDIQNPVNNSVGARPNTYVVNLCSNKTDVFEPFDKQELVWTGYYQPLNGILVDTLDLETGYDFQTGNYYYGDSSSPSVSGPIFGGDTYICRYSYRTTSNLYGLGRFKKGVNSYSIKRNLGTSSGLQSSNITLLDQTSYIWGDIPVDVNAGKSPNFGTNIFGISNDYNVLWQGGQLDNPGTAALEGAGDEFNGARKATISDGNNWSTRGFEVFTTLYQYIVESDDNINYRHAGDPELGVSELNSMFFDKYVAADVLYRSPLGDLTKMDNLLYEDHYSALQDIRVPIAFPKESVSTIVYPNRVIRSSTQDGNFNDTYRYFLGIQYKDFAVNKGQITNIFNLKALLYIHTEKSLFRTKGKQNLELGDATQAYIGSGDLFAQEPDEFIQSIEGYNGLYNKMGSLVTKDGYIFVSRKSKKIFLVKDNEVVDLTQLGINAWARENIPFALEAYGWDPDFTNTPTDAPTGDFGFLVSYDPLFKRTLITKRELVFTDFALDQLSRGLFVYNKITAEFKALRVVVPLEEGTYFKKSGWTISFSNSLSIWASRHSYVPPLYAFNSKYLYSFDYLTVGTGTYPVLYEHSDFSNPGNFYGTVYNFEIDCIFTAPVNAVYSGFKYTADVFNKTNVRLAVEQQFNPGFTSFYVYNTTQISGEIDLIYLNNIRKTDNNWNVNAFRDLSKIANNSGLGVGQINVQGVPYTSTSAPITTEPMFLSEGVINSNYIDSNKPWYEQRKFVDKFLGIRLIANNLSKNLINLYTVTAALRVSPR